MSSSPDSVSAPAGQVVEGRYTGPEGTRPWRLYVPGGGSPSRPRPLLVLLHGCLQDPADLARGTRMDAAADAGGFLVLSPEQPASANPRRCWNWFDAAHQGQGGEPALLHALVTEVVRQQGVDPQRVHLAGISAGGAMATLLAVAYPGLVASLTTVAGIPWKGATSLLQALPVMQRGAGTALPLGEPLWAAMGERGRRFPVLVVHGDQDNVVAPVNGEETARQFVAWHTLHEARAGAPPLSAAPDASGEAGGRPWRESRWVDGAGTPWVRLVRLAGTGHAWSGGSPDGSFTDPAGLSLTALVAAMVTGAAPSAP
jgi:poly(hydroxyalkanoate) depolymerase family esterase